MKILPILLAVVLPVTLCRADLTIVQKIQQGGAADPSTKEMLITTKFKGDQARIDINPQMATIVNLKTGDATTMIIPQKAAMKMSGEMVKSMKKAALGTSGTPKVEPPVATGKKETINGFACEEYTTTMDGKKISLWTTKDAPDAQKAVTQLSDLAGGNDPLSAALTQNSVSGFPIRTEVETPDGGKVTATVVTVSADPVKDSEFVIPADFKSITPSMPPGGPAGQ